MIPDTIDQLAETWQSISNLCAGLDEHQWKTPTDLPGWTVQDNLAHLIGTERMLQGLPPTEHRAQDADHVRNAIGAATEHEVDLRRSRTGAEVLREFDELTADRLTTLRAADERYFATPATTPVGPGDVGLFLQLRVLDNWLHEQDIRRALHLPGHLGGPAAEHTVDRLLLTFPLVVGKRAATPEGKSVVLDVTGAVQRHVIVEVRAGRAQVTPEASSPPVATLTMDTQTFVILSTGRRSADALADKISIEGDTALAGRIIDNLNMMI